jgi:hypothetical protein
MIEWKEEEPTKGGIVSKDKSEQLTQYVTLERTRAEKAEEREVE